MIDVRDNTSITTTGALTRGIAAVNQADLGNVRVNVHGVTLDTALTAIEAFRDVSGHGTTHVDVQDSTITMLDRSGIGIYARNKSENGTGDDVIDIIVRNSTITTKNLASYGIFAIHDGSGDIIINVLDGTSIISESTELDPVYLDTFSHGIYGSHRSIGDIKIDAQAGSITTKGVYSYGIYGRHHEDGDIDITTHAGHTITTTGDYGHGILAHHQGEMDSRTISISVGGSVDASGAGRTGGRRRRRQRHRRARARGRPG